MSRHAKPVETGFFLHPPRRKRPQRQGCCDTCWNWECMGKWLIICWSECPDHVGEEQEEAHDK